jgi:hypothetical protein
MAVKPHDLDAVARDTENGLDTANSARIFRENLRWRTRRGDPERTRTLEAELRAVDAAMKPIRAHIGRAVWEPLPDALEEPLREASRRLQYERRQLKKML